MLPKQEQHKAGKHNEYDPVNLVSISLSDLLPSSLGDALPSGIQISVSPKLPPPNGRRAFYNGRRRSSSLSRWRFIIPRHLPLWVRWTLLSMIVFVMMLQTLLRGQTVPDRRKVYLAGKSKLNWAFTRLKPQKVAIYCGRNSDFGKLYRSRVNCADGESHFPKKLCASKY